MSLPRTERRFTEYRFFKGLRKKAREAYFFLKNTRETYTKTSFMAMIPHENFHTFTKWKECNPHTRDG